jgi:hypothetical protein
MVANAHLVTIQDGTQNIQKDMISEMNILTVAAVKGGFNARVLADLAQQLLEDGSSLGHGFSQIVQSEQFPGPLAFGLQVRVETIVAFSGQHFLFLSSWRHLATPVARVDGLSHKDRTGRSPGVITRKQVR